MNEPDDLPPSKSQVILKVILRSIEPNTRLEQALNK